MGDPFGHEQWLKDHEAVKRGEVSPSDMAEKWGARGGAFVGLLHNAQHGDPGQLILEATKLEKLAANLRHEAAALNATASRLEAAAALYRDGATARNPVGVVGEQN